MTPTSQGLCAAGSLGTRDCAPCAAHAQGAGRTQPLSAGPRAAAPEDREPLALGKGEWGVNWLRE